MHRAHEVEQPLTMEGERVGSLLQWRQEHFQKNLVRRIQHEIMIVVRLKIEEMNQRRFIFVNREKIGRKSIHLAKFRDRFLRPGFLHGHSVSLHVDVGTHRAVGAAGNGHDTRGFGISAPYWDEVFRTSPRARSEAVEDRN